MKIRVIDLLNKIANGQEVPKKIKYQFKTFELNDSGVYLRTDKVKGNHYGIKTLLEYVLTCDLNDEIELIEEDKEIEELNLDADALKGDEIVRTIDYLLESKINELARKLNELKKGK